MALAKDIDVRDQRRIQSKAADFQSRTLARSSAAFEDSLRHGQHTETWDDLVGWTAPASPGVQVSGGRLYSTGTGGAASGANLPLNLAAGDTMRAVFVLNNLAGGGSGAMAVGFDKGAPATAPASGLTNFYGLSLPSSSSGPVRRYTSGATEDLAVGAASGAWVATLTADADYFSVVLRHAASGTEHRGQWPRAGVALGNVAVFLSDARALNGQSIGWGYVSKTTVATAAARSNIEGVAPTVHWSRRGNVGWRIALPKNYDSRVPVPVVIAFHGAGSDETHFADNGNGAGVANAFLSAGYAVLSVGISNNKITYGAQISLDAYVNSFLQASALYALGPVVFYANSMGGIESLLSLAEGRIPGVVAWIGSVPTASLAGSWGFTPGYLDRKAEIRAAYGIAADGSDYAEKTAGHDPLLMHPKAFGGVPMYAVVATDDAAVHNAQHWDLFEPRVAPYSAEMKRLNITGGHSSSAIAGNAASMVAFAQKYAPTTP